MLENKGHDEVDDDWTSEGKERKVDKVHTHGGGINAELFAPPGTHAKSFVFKPLYNTSNHPNKDNHSVNSLV